MFHPDLAGFFTRLRESQGLGFRQAVALAQRRSIDRVTHQTLRGLEKGTTKNPEPDVLRALASLYDMPYEVLAGRFIAVRYGLSVAGNDLPRHGQKLSSSGDAAQARLLHELAEARKAIREMRATAARIAALAGRQILSAESVSAGSHQPRSGRGRGGTG